MSYEHYNSTPIVYISLNDACYIIPYYLHKIKVKISLDLKKIMKILANYLHLAFGTPFKDMLEIAPETWLTFSTIVHFILLGALKWDIEFYVGST